MDRIVIKGGTKLKGTVKISGSKNAALPIMCASLLLDNDTLEIRNVPDLRDIRTLIGLLEHLGVSVIRRGKTLLLTNNNLTRIEAPYDIVRKMRASVLVLGPLLAVKKRARVSLPGGCAIGARPINIHLNSLKKMGARISLEQGYIEGRVPEQLKGETIRFEQKSVGATENIMLASVLARGKTILQNAAGEPEVVDLANTLNAMGAKIEGAGTSTIKITGVKKLTGTSHRIIPDRIEAGTFLVAACATGGEITVQDCEPSHLALPIEKLRETGAIIRVTKRSIHIKAPEVLKSIDITTSEYPGFPTDLQAQFLTLNLFGDSIGIVTENIFENRFMHVHELRRMGANIRIDGNVAIVSGKTTPDGASVMATDLRASASLIIAALAARGKSEILRIYHIDRGYEKIEKKLEKLGAIIRREKGKAY